MAIFATMEQVTPDNFRLRSFRLRGERMTKAQAEALLNHWNRFEIPLQGTIDPGDIFYSFKPDSVIFEIGSGMGEATAEIAAANPTTGYVAVEVHKPGIGALIIRAEKLGLRNIKIIQGDIWEVLQDHIDDGTIDGLHIFFPDPWPKRKQSKRRLLQRPFIELMARKLKTGGEVAIATDWLPYAIEIEKTFAEVKEFSGGVVPRPEWRPLTKFEGKGIRKEHVVTDFKYRRR
jgi:tRNA (guanine-N7-)-methyltransferase